MRSVVACFLVVAVAACTGSPVSRAANPARSASSGSASTTTNTPTIWGTPVVNGRITSVQRRLRSDVGRYNWLASNAGTDTGLHDDVGGLAWSPDGTRIAVRAREDVVQISAEDRSVLVRHPQRRGTSGWLIWLRREQ